MFRTNQAFLAIPVVSLISIASVFGGSPAAAAPSPVPDPDHVQTTIGYAGATPASGTLNASIDATSVKFTPLGGTKCRITDRTTLTLTGSMAGTVEGSTTADVQAPCDVAKKAPSGTYSTAFTLTGTFRGKVANEKAQGRVVYSGTVDTDGTVSAALTLNGRATAELKVRAQIRAVGTYQGIAVVPSSS